MAAFHPKLPKPIEALAKQEALPSSPFVSIYSIMGKSTWPTTASWLSGS